MLRLILVLLVFAVSCAHRPAFQYDANYVAWMDRSADDLFTHPYFASMPMQKRDTENGVKVYSFRNSAGTVAKSGCVSNGWGYSSCDGSATEVACNHVFTISENKVKNYQRVGACGPELLSFRPLVNGEPILTEGEIQRLNSRDVASQSNN